MRLWPLLVQSLGEAHGSWEVLFAVLGSACCRRCPQKVLLSPTQSQNVEEFYRNSMNFMK